MDTLKELCELALSKVDSVKAVRDLFPLANKYNATKLKSALRKFLKL